jgi:hypothetical protein
MTTVVGGEYIDRIEAGFARLEKRITDIDERLRGAEMRDASFSVPTGAKLDAAWRKIDEQAATMLELQRDLIQLTASVRQLESILRWILGLISSLLVAVLVGLATGHLTIGLVP